MIPRHRLSNRTGSSAGRRAATSSARHAVHRSAVAATLAFPPSRSLTPAAASSAARQVISFPMRHNTKSYPYCRRVRLSGLRSMHPPTSTGSQARAIGFRGRLHCGRQASVVDVARQNPQRYYCVHRNLHPSRRYRGDPAVPRRHCYRRQLCHFQKDAGSPSDTVGQAGSAGAHHPTAQRPTGAAGRCGRTFHVTRAAPSAHAPH